MYCDFAMFTTLQAQNGVEPSEKINNNSYSVKQSQKEKIEKELYQIIDRIFPPLAIRYLLVLQSTVSMQTSTAKQSSGVIYYKILKR